MKKITPYKSRKEALTALDNGGRFYNIFTKAGDGVITQAEIGKVGGLFNNKQGAVLFLELATSQLDENAKSSLLTKMETDMQANYKKYKPQKLLASQVKTEGVLASGAIVTGIPKLTESKSNFTGFIMVPISTGNITTFTMIPLIEEYDVYELRDETTSETFIIAHNKGKTKLPEQKIKVAGIIKELQSEESKEADKQLFLEVLYHADVM
jgi:hypothetical protein